jgi:hypothetical protein
MEIVNGYVCRNCTDVANAKKGVDPARPKDGPEGAFAADRSERSDKSAPSEAAPRGPAVTFGGQAEPPAATGVEAVRPTPYTPGAAVSLKV